MTAELQGDENVMSGRRSDGGGDDVVTPPPHYLNRPATPGGGAARATRLASKIGSRSSCERSGGSVHLPSS